jgi:uncharacterized membrane protein YphA (DoxX/SURF4 family)
MLSTSQRTAAYTSNQSLLRRIVGIVKLPFTHRYASVLWLAVRIYLGWLWFQFGLDKLNAGWLSSDPVGGMLKLVADGTLDVPFEFYRGVAGWLVESGATVLLSHGMPFLEMAVALSFISGVLVVPATVGAILLNVNFLLSGIGQLPLDGRFIALQLLMLLAFRVVSLLGVEKPGLRIVANALRKIRSARNGNATTV